MTGHNNNYAGHGYPTSDTMARAALKERMRITAAGYVGIGPTNPVAKLHIAPNAINPGWQYRTQ